MKTKICYKTESMSYLEKVYSSPFFLVIFIIGGSYFLSDLFVQIIDGQLGLKEALTNMLWIGLSIIYLIDCFVHRLFCKHRESYITSIFLTLIILAILNKTI